MKMFEKISSNFFKNQNLNQTNFLKLKIELGFIKIKKIIN